MRILERNVYVGPSLYAHFPVIRLVLDLGALEDWPTGRLGAAYVDALLAALLAKQLADRQLAVAPALQSLLLLHLQ